MLQSAVATAAAAARERERETEVEPSDELIFVLEAKYAFVLRDKRTLRFQVGDVILCELARQAPAGWAHGRNAGNMK